MACKHPSNVARVFYGRRRVHAQAGAAGGRARSSKGVECMADGRGCTMIGLRVSCTTSWPGVRRRGVWIGRSIAVG